MVYIFVFTGEFGYEILNWVGVIRKFSQSLSHGDRIICCSRKGLKSFYNDFSEYVDVSHLAHFKKSRADRYGCYTKTNLERLYKYFRIDIQSRVNREIKAYVYSVVKDLQAMPHEFIFSSEQHVMHNLKFGFGSIYGNLDIDNNLYRVPAVDSSHKAKIEASLGFNLDEPYILCQSAKRAVVARSTQAIPTEKLLEPLSKKIKVVLLQFQTGRYADSYSNFAHVSNCFVYAADSFDEQGCLIANSYKCLFFTEGDFRSHIYLPPCLGKDVVAIAPADVYKIKGEGRALTSPIDFWNENVFTFGGQIIYKQFEEVFKSPETIEVLIGELLAPQIP